MGKFRYFQGIFFLFSIVTISCLCPEKISDHEISNHLFKQGNQWDRPVLKHSTPVQVLVDLYVRRLLDVDQQFRQVILLAYLHIVSFNIHSILTFFIHLLSIRNGVMKFIGGMIQKSSIVTKK